MDTQFPGGSLELGLTDSTECFAGPGWKPSSPWRPACPRVAMTTWVSTPSAEYFARVPPKPRDSSSGWASRATSLRVFMF